MSFININYTCKLCKSNAHPIKLATVSQKVPSCYNASCNDRLTHMILSTSFWQICIFISLLLCSLIPYSGKLSREKTFADRIEVTILWRKLLRNAKTYHRWVRHAQISWGKLPWMALKPRNLWMFSPSKIFRYTNLKYNINSSLKKLMRT